MLQVLISNNYVLALRDEAGYWIGNYYWELLFKPMKKQFSGAYMRN